MLITNQSNSHLLTPIWNHWIVMQNSWEKKDTIRYTRFLKMCKDSFYKLLFKCDLAVGCSTRDIISRLYMPNLNTPLCLYSTFLSIFSSRPARYSLRELGAGWLFSTSTVCRKRAYGYGGHVWWSAADEHDPCRELQLQRCGVCECSCTVAARILPFMHGILH